LVLEPQLEPVVRGESLGVVPPHFLRGLYPWTHSSLVFAECASVIAIRGRQFAGEDVCADDRQAGALP
jgi:hypothetical protein